MKEDELIKAGKDESEGYAHCVTCGEELEMTIKFVKLVGISTSSCSICQGSLKLQKFMNRVTHFKDELKLSNEETKKRLKEEGYFIDVIK